MPRYIDVDFLAKFPHWERIVKELECAPTADVTEVKHGKWIWVAFDNKCSICGAYLISFLQTKFCPNCGARMDGDEK